MSPGHRPAEGRVRWSRRDGATHAFACGSTSLATGFASRGATKRPWSDGTTALELSAEELAERLVALVPPPRANQGLYGGVLASIERSARGPPSGA
ncbi:MAG: hypothetical protein EA397_17645 [Deltaproteobacteria bacterium]|nr:MAG: hypothetical protein EA397_17645 [Deltaproteobacteria bacterium]